MRKPRRGEPQVPRITTAPEPLADDLARRTRRYLVQMGVRAACFVVAVVTWGHVPVWLSAVLLVLAVVLPYIAVLLANAGREQHPQQAEYFEPRAIGAGRPGGSPGLDETAPHAPDARDARGSEDLRGQWSP